MKQKWINFSDILDSLRIFPRLFITAYIAFFLYSGHWFMQLDNPNPEQSAFVSVVIGAGAAWFGLFLGSRSDRYEVNQVYKKLLQTGDSGSDSTSGPGPSDPTA